MNFSGLWTALGVAVFGAALSMAGLIFFDESKVIVVAGWGFIALGAFRAIGWLRSNLSGVFRGAGEIAAKGANHVDTFKEAFKEGKNK